MAEGKKKQVRKDIHSVFLMPRLLLYKSGAPATADSPFEALIKTRMHGTGLLMPMHTQTQVGPHVIWPLTYPI